MERERIFENIAPETPCVGIYARLAELDNGAPVNAADSREAVRLWALQKAGAEIFPDEEKYIAAVFRASPTDAPADWRDTGNENIFIPTWEWGSEVESVAMSVMKELQPHQGPKINRMTGRTYGKKEWGKMAKSTQEVYGRKLKKIDMEIREGNYTDADILCMLLATAHTRSRSTFFAERALLQRWAEDNGRDELGHMVNTLPEWSNLKRRFGEHPQYISAKTRERQKTNISPAILRAMCLALPEARNQKLAPLLLLLSGARLSELQSLTIYPNPDGSVIIKLDCAKLGCARKGAPKSRRIQYSAGTTEANQLLTITHDFGVRPLADINTITFRSNWRTARAKAAKQGVTVPDAHSFRHAFATEQRARIEYEMELQHGMRWRNDAAAREKARQALATALGHQSRQMSQVYGRSVRCRTCPKLK